MKIKEQLPKLNPSTFIEDYCKLKNITDIDKFINPTWDNIEDCSNYDGMVEGFELFDKHVMTDSVIGILVDSDNDGVMSSATIYNYIKATSQNQEIIAFHHNGKLHGLDDKVVFKQIIEAKPNLLILPDGSTNDVREINYLISIGIDVLVLDHHEKEKETILEYDKTEAVVINNKLSPKIQNKSGSGTLVTWKFCMYCDEQYGTMEAINLIDLSAWSLIADVVDCNTLESSAVLNYGLSHTTNKLLQALELEYSKGEPITPTMLGWVILPKINGIIRNDNIQDHIDIFTALTEPNKIITWQKGVRSKEQEWNIVDKVVQQGKTSTDKKIQDAMAVKFMESIIPTLNLDDKLTINIIDKSVDLSHTLTGLVAGKLSNQYNKPCVLIRDRDVKGKELAFDEVNELSNGTKLFANDATIELFTHDVMCYVGKNTNKTLILDMQGNKIKIDENTRFYQIDKNYVGSLRSRSPMKTIINESGLFNFAKGHESSCGVSLKMDKLSEIKQWASTLDLDSVSEVAKSYAYNSIPSQLFSTITEYAPLYCKGFEKPLFHIKPFVISNTHVQKMGNATMKITLDGITCIKFFCSKKVMEEFYVGEEEMDLEIELIVELNINEWNGYVNNQLIIKDYSVKVKDKINIEDIDIENIF